MFSRSGGTQTVRGRGAPFIHCHGFPEYDAQTSGRWHEVKRTSQLARQDTRRMQDDSQATSKIRKGDLTWQSGHSLVDDKIPDRWLTQVCAKAEEAACLDKSGGVIAAVQACVADEFERQDKRLNTAYKVLLGAVSEKRKTELRDVQRKWIAFLDANCSFYDDPEGGTADRLAANECRVTHTALRASRST
jgi:uncharacterized protein YecT (DUF1311 family)